MMMITEILTILMILITLMILRKLQLLYQPGVFAANLLILLVFLSCKTIIVQYLK